MPPKSKYICPRCGYKTDRKSSMVHHLNNLKKLCPAVVKDIELTEDIKDAVLNNRVYHIPKPPKAPETVINQTINNYNQLNSLIQNMDPIKKLEKYNKFMNLEHVNFQDHVEDVLKAKINGLEDGTLKDYALDARGILSTVDEVTRTTCIERMNVFHNATLDKLCVFDYGEWMTWFTDLGVDEILEKTKTNFFDYYECYLLRKLVDTERPFPERSQVREYLQEYYTFIASFNIDPFVRSKNNHRILYNVDDDRHFEDVDARDISAHSIADEYYPFYKGIKEELSPTDVMHMKRDVEHIITKNCKASLIELNKRMIELMQLNGEFKKDVVNDITFGPCA